MTSKLGTFDGETRSLIQRLLYSTESKGSSLEIGVFFPQLECMSQDKGLTEDA